MRLFRLDSSIRVDDSISRSLADIVEAEWRDAAGPTSEVIRRDLGRAPLAPCWAQALAGAPDATAMAAQLVDELLAADAFVVATPLYNFGVPYEVKHWVDLIITDPRAVDVNVPWLAGRPAVLVSVKGGGYGEGTPRSGWDHGTPWLRRILADVWGLDLRVVEVELTAATWNPAMAELRDLAEQQLDAGRQAAATHGRALCIASAA